MSEKIVNVGIAVGATTKSSVGSVMAGLRAKLGEITSGSKDATKQTEALGKTIKGAFDPQAIKSWVGGLVAGLTAALGLAASIGQAMGFADQMRDMRITGGYSTAQEQALSTTARSAALTSNTDRSALASGMNVLAGDGVSMDQQKDFAPLLGQASTALRNDIKETANAFLTLREMGITDSEGMQRSLDKLAHIGGQGAFNPAMMISAFAGLGDTIKAAGIKGEQAIGEIAAGLQIAEGAMGGDAAQGAMKGWIEDLRSAKTQSAYENSMGINYTASMAKLQSQGMTEFQASLELAGAAIRDRLNEKDQKKLLAGDKDGSVATQLQQMGLNEIFKDANQARLALTLSNKKDEYKA